ncbi:MAG: transcription antitermination factor NusB [Phycisphaerae bacterium]
MTHDPSPGRSTRDRALRALIACYEGRQFGRQFLAQEQAAAPLPSGDAALAVELVMGTNRHRITAEHVAKHWYRGRWAGLKVPVRVILALAIYQLCWLERIPDYAAIDQAVRQAKRYGRSAAALVNALLRKVATSRGPLIARPEDADVQCFLPVDDQRGRVFGDRILPHPARRPLDYLVAAMGHPPWLVERWHRRFKPDLCRQICLAGQRRPPLVLRPNLLRCTVDELSDRLASAGYRPRRIEGTDAVALPNAPTLAVLPEFHEGLCQPQDSTAQIAVALAAPQRGEFVLDYCAGAGTKATQAAEQMGNDGLVIATDINPEPLDRAAENAERLGIDILRTVHLNQLDDALSAAGRRPDVILVDAPCTNTGVLARRPEARFRASHRSMMELVDVQRSIFKQAVAHAGPQTRLIYSTCSLEEEENEQQIAWFCDEHAGWRAMQTVFTTPDADRDGGFAAVLTPAS